MLLKNIRLSLLLITLSFFACKTSKKSPLNIEKIQPFNIDFSIAIENDSLVYRLKNTTYCPIRFYSYSDNEQLNSYLKESGLDLLTLLGQEERVVKKSNKLNKSENFFIKNIKKSAKYGSLNEKVSNTFLALPYPKGKSYSILQGCNTDFTHKYGYNLYSLDFKMNQGEELTAVYDGVIIAEVDGYTIGGRNKALEDYGNYIMIYHEQLGTYSTYYHLKPQGSIVKIGDKVKENQVIGYSGHTGYSTEPHLHYCYSIPDKKELQSGNGLISIPITFKNNLKGVDLKKGQVIKN